VAIGFAGIRFYLNNTEVIPSVGGTYSEGIIGSPRYLNPVLSPANDADHDLTRVVFSSLLKYDNQGNLIPDLAEKYEVKEQGKVYDFYLKKNAFWHDGKPVTTDDLIFTIQTIQDPSFHSPLRITWGGIEVEKIDDYTVRFKIKNAYAPFPYNATFGILPKHIWQNVSAADFALNEKNLKPIGSGPYAFSQLAKNSDGSIISVALVASKNYYLGGPFIKYLTFKFYADEDKAIAALKKSEIQGINYLSPKNLASLQNTFKNGLNISKLMLPRYFSIFFNQTQNKALGDKSVRTALALATPKQKLVDEVLNGLGEKIDSPLIPGMLGFTDQVKKYDFDLEKAKTTLTSAGWIDSNNDGVREKIEKGKEVGRLEFTLITIPWQELAQTAAILQDSWQQIGVKITVETKDTTALIQENIRPRDYQMLIFGELLNIDPDPFAFWHSSQIKDPGQNLSLYDNAQVDAILQNARQDLDPASRAKKYEQFSQIVSDDLPVVFLFDPYYLYPVYSQVKIVDFKILPTPSDRFSQIETWYITTSRTWKHD